MKKKLVVLSGAGISAESGIPTFRGTDGLWEGHRVEDVASPQGWKKNPELVLEFYNLRRKAVRNAEPNPAHTLLAELEEFLDVHIITQNIDDLHERGGSSNVLHLHGEITKACNSEGNHVEVIPLQSKDIYLGDTCSQGTQLRPFIVWFGEEVPLIPRALEIVQGADIFLVIGTSLAVYPAAGLINYTKVNTRKFLIDPNLQPESSISDFHMIKKGGAEGMKDFYQEMKNLLSSF